MTTITHLECAACGKRHESGRLHNLCACGGPLLVRYDLDKLREGWSREWIPSGPTSMWRYAPVLPVSKPAAMTTLGEGMTPLVHTTRLGARLGSEDLWVKDEGVNPTGSFKARGLSCAVSMCVELGVKKVAIPSAGNAAGAMAAYAAAAGIEAHIFMPRDVPQANYIECRAAGAHVTLVDGLISDCARIVASRKDEEGWFDVSTLKEPYRIEGKKTMGYEVAEQFRWSKRPKMIAVQAEGCRPIVKAFEEGKPRSEFFEHAETVASGLRVPKALGDFLVLDAVRQSAGTCIAVSDEEMLQAAVELAADEGIFAAPEGGACVAALKKLLASGFLTPKERIVIYNTGSGLKYVEAFSTRFPR
ncbi:MAG: threonine synthase [Bryobacteraceae bacterium]